MTAQAGTLRIDVFADFAEFSKGLDKGAKDLKKFQRDFNKIGSDLSSVGSRLSIGITAPFVLFSKAIAKNSVQVQNNLSDMNASFNKFSTDLGETLLPLMNQVAAAAKSVADGFAQLSPESKALIANTFAIGAALGPILIGFGSLIKIGSVLAGAFGLVTTASRVVAGAFNGVAIGAAEAAVAQGILDKSAIRTASSVATLAGRLGLAATALAVLGPIALDVGKKLGNLFFDANKQSDKFLQTLYALPKLLGGFGGKASDAAEAVARVRIEQGKFESDVPAVQEAINKLRLTYVAVVDATSPAARAVSSFFEIVRGGVDKIKEGKKAVDDYLANFRKLHENDAFLKEHAADIERLRGEFDPVGEALKKYYEDLNIAKVAGLDLATAHIVLTKTLVDAAGGAELATYQLSRLPIEAQKAIEAMSNLPTKVFDDKQIEAELVNPFEGAMKGILDGIDAAQAAQQKKVDAALKDRERTVREVSDAIGDAVTGTKSWGDAFKDLVSNMLRIRVIQPVIDGFADQLFGKPTAGGTVGGAGLGSILSGAGKFIGGLFGGAKANGGPVMPGRTYLVGEQGRELFTPDTPGRISTASETRRGAGGVTMNIYTPDVGSFRASARQTSRATRLALAR